MLEGVLARGDRKVAAVIEEAYRKGAIYDSWSEYFNNDIWMKAFEPAAWTLISIRCVSEALMKCSRGISSTRV